MEKECDVLVVGAGPAGSSAARAAAGAGAKTILIDKKEEIGVPVQCAEAIGKYLFPLLPFKIPKEQLVWKIAGMTFWTEDVQVERKGGLWAGYAINRKIFDKWLASLAVDAGAKLFTSAELVDVEFREKHCVERAFVRTPHGMMTIKPKVVIAADGVESMVLKLLGFKIDKKGSIGEVIGFEMQNLNLESPYYEHIFIGDFAPGGYAYIFPKSKHVANVGVATLLPDKSLEEYYEEFIETPEVKRQIKGGVVVEEKSGKAPIENITEKWTYGNVVLAGDAANQNIKPFVEGILPSIICGDIAGRISFSYLHDGTPLDSYHDKVMKIIGNFFKASDIMMRIYRNLDAINGENRDVIKLGIMANILSLKLVGRDYDCLKEVKSWKRSKIRLFLTSAAETAILLQTLCRAYGKKILLGRSGKR